MQQQYSDTELEALLEQSGYEESGISEIETPEVKPAPAVEPKTEVVKEEKSGISKPKDPAVHVIQSVSEPSFRVKQTKTGQGTTAVKSADEAEKNADVQALKRKAKQLQYLLEEQSEESEK